MPDAFLEIAILRCPKCKNLLAEPTWFLELEQDLQCSSCRKVFPSKRNEIDRKLVKFTIEGKRIEKVELYKK